MSTPTSTNSPSVVNSDGAVIWWLRMIENAAMLPSLALVISNRSDSSVLEALRKAMR